MAPTSTITVLDGGMSTALEQQGVEVGGRLWTARLLVDSPDSIRRAHRSFFDAGARVATTATYQASEVGLREAGFDGVQARRLMATAVALAREARDQSDAPADALVAASIGPYGATLADGSEYRGRYGVSAARLRDFHAPRLDVLAAAGPDAFAVETIPDIDEAIVLVELLDEIGLPAWFSYSVRGSETCAGQPLRDAYSALADCSVLIAAGVNCSAEADVLDAVGTAVSETALPAIAYPNRGGVWDPVAKSWSQDRPFNMHLIEAWIAAGATFIGGCCGFGPSDIAELAEAIGDVGRA